MTCSASSRICFACRSRVFPVCHRALRDRRLISSVYSQCVMIRMSALSAASAFDLISRRQSVAHVI